MQLRYPVRLNGSVVFSIKEKRLSYHCLRFRGTDILSTLPSIQEPTAKQLNLNVESVGPGCFCSVTSRRRWCSFNPLQRRRRLVSRPTGYINSIAGEIEYFDNRIYGIFFVLSAVGRDQKAEKILANGSWGHEPRRRVSLYIKLGKFAP